MLPNVWMVSRVDNVPTLKHSRTATTSTYFSGCRRGRPDGCRFRFHRRAFVVKPCPLASASRF